MYASVSTFSRCRPEAEFKEFEPRLKFIKFGLWTDKNQIVFAV